MVPLLLVLFTIIAISASGVKRSLSDIIAEKSGEELLPDSSYIDSFKVLGLEKHGFVSLIGLILCSLWCNKRLSSSYGKLVFTKDTAQTNQLQFIHSVHACENEVDCKYCHHSAYESKHAGIPSTNVCMNCHKAIKKGKRTGEEEIAKIYAAIGFDPATGTYIDGEGNNGHSLPQDSFEGEPIKWNKVHNLPDHVFFSHEQHVAVGGLQCQNCHGDVATYSVGRIAPVEEINELRDKFPGIIELSKPTLTMGWCLECHNKAEIDMAHAVVTTLICTIDLNLL